MIETAAVQALTQQLGQTEERLSRLLMSGWRQARSEAADLRADAEALREAGLPELAARVAAVAESSSPTEALQAIALATSACRLLRTRLPGGPAPDDWAPLTLARPTRAARTEALIPVSRLLLDGREVWVCTRANRNDMLLVEPPFPAPTSHGTARDDPEVTARLVERLRFQMTRVLGESRESPPASHWLNRRLSGTLHWRAQYPLGVHGDVGFLTLEDPAWVTAQDEPNGLLAFQQLLSHCTLQDGAPLFWNAGSFRIRMLHRAEASAYTWVDPSAAVAFEAAPAETLWAITWTDGAAIVPVALLTPGGRAGPPRLMHLIPGASEDILAVPR